MAGELKAGTTDHLAVALRASLGAVPWLGPLFSELITATLPRQRIDRVCLYVERLSVRLEALELRALLEESGLQSLPPAGAALLEDGARLSAHALSSERIDQIALVVSTGLSGPENKLQDERELITLIGQLVDRDLAFLMQLQSPYSYPLDMLESSTDYRPKIDENLPEKERARLDVVWEISRHRRSDERKMMVQKIMLLGMMEEHGEKGGFYLRPGEVFWPMEAHEYHLSGLGRYVLWRLGLSTDGMTYVTGGHEGPLPPPQQMTDEVITLMVDYAYANLK